MKIVYVLPFYEKFNRIKAFPCCDTPHNILNCVAEMRYYLIKDGHTIIDFDEFISNKSLDYDFGFISDIRLIINDDNLFRLVNEVKWKKLCVHSLTYYGKESMPEGATHIVTSTDKRKKAMDFNFPNCKNYNIGHGIITDLSTLDPNPYCRKSILYLGRIYQEEVAFLKRIAAECPDSDIWVGCWFGDSEDVTKEKFRSEFPENNIKLINDPDGTAPLHTRCFVPFRAKGNYIHHANVGIANLAMPGIVTDGDYTFVGKCLHYWAYGCPSIVDNIGSQKYLVEDFNGKYYSRYDFDDFIRKLKLMLSSEYDRRKIILWARNNFSWMTQSRKITKIMSEDGGKQDE